jgi:hypothetical protein
MNTPNRRIKNLLVDIVAICYTPIYTLYWFRVYGKEKKWTNGSQK